MQRFLMFFHFIIVSVCLAQPTGYEGFGSVTVGGEGKPVYHVTSLKDDGSFGTLRDAVSQGNRYILFDTAGTIVVSEDLEINGSHITIDGSTAPAPGITIKKSKLKIVALVFRGCSDIIIKYIRVYGVMNTHSELGYNHAGTISVVGSSAAPAYNIVFDHITTRNAVDSGLDLWGEIHDLTIQYSLISYSYHPQTISHYSHDGEFLKRRNISIHHNIYARNDQRNPQLRADTRDVDYVNNIVYDWDYWESPDGYRGYGIRIKNKWEPGEPKVTMNIINNAFIATSNPERALVYGKDEGAEENDKGPKEILPQGSVYLNSEMDSIFVRGNLLPKENMDQYSTISGSIPIPEYAKVTTYDVAQLADSVIPFVGTHYPLADEKEIFSAISDSLKKFSTWSIGIYTGPSPFQLSSPANVSNPILTANEVTDVKATLVAHPFMIKSDSLYYMFFTIKNKKIKRSKGYIGLAESKDGFEWKYTRIALTEPFSLSYPTVFKWQNKYYMIPETHTENSVRLYRAADFPEKWVYEKELLSGDDFISPSIVRYKNMWWMFTVRRGNETLRLFYAYDLKGVWTEHPLSPVVENNPKTARPGGKPFIMNGKLYRIAQDSYPIYGYQLRAFQITNISTTAYEEKIIDTPIIRATSTGWNADAMHHVDLHQISENFWFAPVDGKGVSWKNREDK